MHMKQICIQNFRSFRQQAELSPSFHSGTNTIVGRNGSGKSNLLDAIQFVLLATPRWAHLRQEDRQALLHEGSGAATLTAFVEVVLDNSDHRFSVDQDEVVIRRVIGLKKDELFLQRKRATKQTIMSLLEGAGFCSKSNPYFLVQQGRIQALCLMNDAERLAVLKEVAGTTVYDTKKQESLVQMQENNDKILKVHEILERIEARLQELASEKRELEEYTAADKQRRGCQYCLYERELHKAQTSLHNLEEERAQHATFLADLHEECKVTHTQIRNLEGTLRAKSAQARQNARQLQLLEQDGKDAASRQTNLQLECQELSTEIAAAQAAHEEAALQLKQVQAEIQQTEIKLEQELTPQLRQAESALEKLQHQRTQAKMALKSLQAKQGRGKQFASKQERDAFLQSRVDDLEASIQDKEQQMQHQRDTLAATRRSLESMQQEMQKQQEQLDRKAEGAASLNKNLQDLKKERQSLQESRKADWRAVEQLRDQVREARNEWHKSKSDFRKVMPRATALGLQALETLVEQERLTTTSNNDNGKQLYFGTVLENIQLKQDKYATAVEVAAQNALFHVIVENDEVAAKLLSRLEKDKLGRVTFLPLNQLRVDGHDGHRGGGAPLPSASDAEDVCSLLEACVQYDPKIQLAMQHVFGKKLLARSQQIASEWSGKCNVDAITLDGDLCSNKGAVSGGYVDVSKSRWKAHVKLRTTKATLDELQGKQQQAEQQARQVDQQTSQLLAEIHKHEGKHGEVTRAVQNLETSMERMQSRMDQQLKQQEKAEKTTIPHLERDIENLQAEKARLEQEMGTELTETLSAQEKQEVERFKTEIASLNAQIESQSDKVTELAAEHQKTTSLLQDNLLKRQEELTDGANAGGAGGEEEEEEEEEQQDEPEEDEEQAKGSRRRRAGAGSKKAARRRSPQRSRPSSNRRRSSVSGRLSFAAAQAQRQENLRELQVQLEEVTRSLAEIEERLTEARDAEASFQGEMITLKDELGQVKFTDNKNSKLVEEARAKSENLLNKRTNLVGKKEDYSRKIQELGSLPAPSELEKFSKKKIPELLKSLDAINKKLKKFAHVNKKAYDQYVNFNDQRESLLKRKEELDQGSVKIQELIESLDQKKDEAINRTFRGVSAHFKDVFKELVPNGAGELIMRTAIDEGGAEGGTDEEQDVSDNEGATTRKKKKKSDPNNPDVSLYRGVGIKVRFSEVGENFLMSQLSGGQKALVAMALIFAIQRCDPAPFYIFDELDQALDSSYRAAVANLIERQANSKENPTQFIVTTFRPELVSVANRCYGISLQNKMSNLHHLNKKDALNFVASLLSEEEAVGEVSTITTSRASLSHSSRKRKAIEHGSSEMQEDNVDDDDEEESADTTNDEDDETSAE